MSLTLEGHAPARMFDILCIVPCSQVEGRYRLKGSAAHETGKNIIDRLKSDGGLK